MLPARTCTDLCARALTQSRSSAASPSRTDRSLSSEMNSNENDSVVMLMGSSIARLRGRHPRRDAAAGQGRAQPDLGKRRATTPNAYGPRLRSGSDRTARSVRRIRLAAYFALGSNGCGWAERRCAAMSILVSSSAARRVERSDSTFSSCQHSVQSHRPANLPRSVFTTCT